MFVSLIRLVFAQDQQDAIPFDTPRVTTLGPDSLPQVFNFIINLVLGIGIALTIIFLIVGGIQYITSRGDQKAAEAARHTLTNAVIGFIIVIGAFTIKQIVGGALGAENAGGVDSVFESGANGTVTQIDDEDPDDIGNGNNPTPRRAPEAPEPPELQ